MSAEHEALDDFLSSIENLQPPYSTGDEAEDAEWRAQFIETLQAAAQSARGRLSAPADGADPFGVSPDAVTRHEALAQDPEARSDDEREQPASSDQIVGKTQAIIASGAAGNVKLCAQMGGTPTEFGDAFSAYNLGPGSAPSGAFVLLQQGDHGQPCFQYTTDLLLANNTGIISSQTAVVGSATTAKRSDAADGLNLVGDPADGTAAGAATLEFTATSGGLQVKLGQGYNVGAVFYDSLQVVTTADHTGLAVKLLQANGLKVAANGVALAVDDESLMEGLLNKLQVNLKTNGGLLKAGGGTPGIYVNVDDSTINLSATGQIQLKVAPAPAAHNILSTAHGDTTAAAVVRGDVVTGQGATPKWTRLGISAPGDTFRLYLGTAYGDTEPGYKDLFASAPSDRPGATADAAAAGTSVYGARLDHAHNLHDHHALHENGGAQEVSVAGLSGELADVQPPKIAGLTAETALDITNDYFPFYDNSASANRKISGANLRYYGGGFTSYNGEPVVAGLTADESFHDLNLSGTVGANATAILMTVYTSLANSQWRKDGYTTGTAMGIGGEYVTIVVPCAAGVIEYFLGTGSSYSYNILGWWN